MIGGLSLFPEAASTIARGVDALYLFLLVVTAFFSGLIFILVFFFAVKYRRRPQNQGPVQVEGYIGLELLWTALPFGITLIMFVWGASLYMRDLRPPEGASDLFVVGRQWMWKIQHPEGRREINELHIPLGTPFKLTLTSQDVIHSFYIPAFRIKQDVVPGSYTTMWFEANRLGEYHLFCAEYCGTQHSGMIGRVVVMEPKDYEQWLGGVSDATPVQAGEKLFNDFNCANCHATGARQRGPQLGGLYGKDVLLQGGGKVKFDESYIRESIITPNAKVVAGLPPVMPTFRGQVSEEQILQLIAYIKSLSPPEGGK